jgi:hypothetical protein
MAAVGTARLTSDILTQRAVGASVPRSQIMDVLHEPNGDAELVLDLVAAESGEHTMINMSWSRDDLEQLLGATSGDEVALVFDRDELASAFGDVEAHGLRSQAAVFAVAAVGALGSTASIASAAATGSDSAGTAATPAAATSTAAEVAALQARSEALNEQYGLGDAGNAAEIAALQARSEALNEQYGLGDAGNAAEIAALQARSQAMNEQYGLGASAAGDTSGGLTIDRATADDALLVGGLLLTIAGATFVVRRTAGGRPA